ncbi:MAG: hypothetical protein GY754_31430 [bacterium]|nr:hypothetical protein [bacterium]
MKKIIFFILLFVGIITYVLAANVERVGTGIEWEAHNIRVVIVGPGNKRITVPNALYSEMMLKSRLKTKYASDLMSGAIKEERVIKVVFDNIGWGENKGLDACPEIVTAGFGATYEELLISRSRAMALLYKTLKTAYTNATVKKVNLGKGYENCVSPETIITTYNTAIAKDDYLEKKLAGSNGKSLRWYLWDLETTDEWKKFLDSKDKNAAKLYFCSKGTNTIDKNEVVYHLNFGIPLNDLYTSELFLGLSNGYGDRVTEHSVEEWENARKRAGKCTACVKKNMTKAFPALKFDASDEFYTMIKGALTYLYYGYYHNLDIQKRAGSKDKDSHINLVKSSLHPMKKLLSKEHDTWELQYFNATGTNMDYCKKVCVEDEPAIKKIRGHGFVTPLYTLWACRLFYQETVATYGKNKTDSEYCTTQKDKDGFPFDSVHTQKPIPAYWEQIEAGTFKGLKWNKRKALVVVVESRDFGSRSINESARLIRKAFEPTPDPDVAERNAKKGIPLLLKLQVGATGDVEDVKGDNDEKDDQ